jgi:hypothetical protein
MGLDIFAFPEDAPLLFAMPGVAPKPAGMKSVLPSLGKPAKLPSPIPTVLPRVQSNPQPDVPSKPVVDPKWRSGSLETMNQRLPSKRPRYKLQVPLDHAHDAARADVLKELASVSHPEDRERYEDDLAMLEAAHASGNEKLLIQSMSNSISAKTFKRLVQELDDREPTVTSVPHLFAMPGEPEKVPSAPKPVKAPSPSQLAPAVKQEFKIPEPKAPAWVPGRPSRLIELHSNPHPEEFPEWHNDQHTHALQVSPEVSRQRINTGINTAYKLTMAGMHPGGDHHGIWKDAADDQTYLARNNIPDNNPHGHEAAAWELDKILGVNMTPTTVVRELGGSVGSVQRWKDNHLKAVQATGGSKHVPNVWESPDIPMAAAFDVAIGNADRHMANWMVDPKTNRFALIDHGLSFPDQHNPKDPRSTWTSDILHEAYAKNIPVPPKAVEWESKLPAVTRSLERNGMTPEQVAMTQERIQALAIAARRGWGFKEMWNHFYKPKVTVRGIQ